MPHQFMDIDCGQCKERYCPACKRRCPQCERIDIAGDSIMKVRARMRRHTEKIPEDSFGKLYEEWQSLEQRAGMEAHEMVPGRKIIAKVIDYNEFMRLHEVREYLFLDFFDLLDMADCFALQQHLL